MINRPAIKADAKNLCKTARPSLITMGAIFTGISLLFSTLSSRALGTNISQDAARHFMTFYYNGDYERAMKIAITFKPSSTGEFISAVISVVMWIVTAGFVIFIMNTVRSREASYANILDGFSMTVKILLLNLLTCLIVGALSCLLVVPGIIFGYAYRQALFILIDNPDMGIVQCLKESRMMMKGHKWELFRFDLSFLGWFLLAAIIPLAGIWVNPYTKTSYVMYYDVLCGKKNETDYAF